MNLILQFHVLLLMGIQDVGILNFLARFLRHFLHYVFCFVSIINGYARNRMGREGVSLLEAMIQKGLIPYKVTFLCVLSGCNHAGLVEEGKLVFNLMKSF